MRKFVWYWVNDYMYFVKLLKSNDYENKTFDFGYAAYANPVRMQRRNSNKKGTYRKVV